MRLRWYGGTDGLGARLRGPLGAVVLLVLAAVTGPAAAAGKTMTLNLSDTDLTAVIATVAEMTGKNFIVDPRVKGKVTVISNTPMSADEVYQVFLSILNVQGFAAIPGKDVIKIVPEVNAKQEAIATRSDRHPGSGDEYVTRVLSVKNVSAAQLVPILRPLLPQEGHLAAYPQTNVLIISGTAANVERIAHLIDRIDKENQGDVEVIPLKHASADEVVRILTSINQEAAKGPGASTDVKIIADTRTNSVLLSGDKATRLRLKAVIADLDTPLESSGYTKVIYLRYAKAKDLATVLNGIGKSLGGSLDPKAAKGGPNGVSVYANEATNSLVINAPPAVVRDMESVIRKLDIRRAQVLVRAVIAEVTTQKATELGVQWGFDGSTTNQPVGVINFSGSGSGLSNLLSTPPSVGDGLTLGVGDTASGSGFRIAALLRALSGDADTNILSTPSIVTMDNHEAQIVVGQNVPFVTGSYTSTGTGSTPTNPFQTIQRQDVGLTLKVTPQINEGNAVKLDISQEVSSIASATTGASDLITNKRSIKTSVMVDDGQMVVLGGLIEDNLRQSVQKVPLLGDIPILGWLFSYRTTNKVKTNLMVFLYPSILRDASQNMAFSSEKYNYIRAQQLMMKDKGVNLMSDDVSPTLPKLKEFLKLPPPYKGDAGGSIEQPPSADAIPPQPAKPDHG